MAQKKKKSLRCRERGEREKERKAGRKREGE